MTNLQNEKIINSKTEILKYLRTRWNLRVGPTLYKKWKREYGFPATNIQGLNISTEEKIDEWVKQAFLLKEPSSEYKRIAESKKRRKQAIKLREKYSDDTKTVIYRRVPGRKVIKKKIDLKQLAKLEAEFNRQHPKWHAGSAIKKWIINSGKEMLRRGMGPKLAARLILKICRAATIEVYCMSNGKRVQKTF